MIELKTIFVWAKDRIYKMVIANGRVPLSQKELSAEILQTSFKAKEIKETNENNNIGVNRDDGLRG